MKKKIINYVVVVIGFLLLGIGLFLLKTIENPDGIMQTLPYVCIGVGCGFFGQGMGNALSQKVMQKNPNMQKKMDIEKNDERNIAISNRAKGAAFDTFTFVFGALMLIFTLMNVDTAALLLFVFAYLFIQGCAVYYRCAYEKRM